MLHPGLADVYRRKVEKLTEALNKDELRTEAAETLRSMIQAIRLVPEDGVAGDRACWGARRDIGADQRKNPPAFWAEGSTGNAGCGGRI